MRMAPFLSRRFGCAAKRRPATSHVPAALAVAAILLALGPTPVRAQSDFFFFLRPPASIPQAPRERNNNRWPGSLFQPPQQPDRPQQQRPAEAPAVRKPAEPEGTLYASADAAARGRRQPPSQFVLVLGDRVGAQLAQGLADAYVPERERIAFIENTVDDSGFLPPPTDWMSRAPGAITAGRPNVTVLALGSEDLKPITENNLVLEPLTDRWIEAYSRRVDELLALLREKAGRVIVVGLAPVANAGVSEDYARLNEVLRARAARAGFPFVNVWDGFVDEDGKYLATGPAVDGQRRRLRFNDGIRFTRAGGRKLAFFVEKDLNRLLEDPAKPTTSVEGTKAPLALMGGPTRDKDPKPETTATPAAATARSAADALREGVAPPSLRGRADDFSWPPPSDAPPAAH